MSLVADELTVRRGGRAVLDEVSAKVSPGEILAVMGPSGCGKSVLLSALAGLIAPARGSVAYNGSPVVVGDSAHLRRTGVIFQTYGLVPLLTAGENLEVALRARGVRAGEARRRAEAGLAELGLAQMVDRDLDELSGGEQQRVAVARALAVEPEIVIADEPTSELDAANRDRVLPRLAAAAESGAIVVVATHDPEVAAIASTVVRLVDGRVRGDSA